jgi:preprotein translocase SecE subunit
MAYVTKSTQQESKVEADADLPEAPPPKPAPESDGTPPRRPTARSAAPSGGGFFTIYKKGQGYWTRMGTAIAIGVIAIFTAYNLFVNIPSLLPSPVFPPTTKTDELARQVVLAAQSEQLHFRIALGVAVAFLVGFVSLGFWITNKPNNVDFLIATDSEMKKVNWTSRKDLIASTKIVIIFMFSVAMFLFLVDICFQYLFHVIGVLKTGPFGS